MLTVGFWNMAFTIFRWFASLPSLLSVFIINECWILPNDFCIYWDNHVIFNLCSVNMMHHIDWFRMLNHSLVPGINSTWSWCRILFSSVQLLSHVLLFVTPWTIARQASLSITNSQSLLKLMSTSQWCHSTISSSVILFSSHLQSFPASGSFQMSQFFVSGGQSIGVSASISVLPMNVQDWSPLGWTGWISLPSKRLWKVFSSTTVQKHQLFGFLYGPTFTSVHDYWGKP